MKQPQCIVLVMSCDGNMKNVSVEENNVNLMFIHGSEEELFCPTEALADFREILVL